MRRQSLFKTVAAVFTAGLVAISAGCGGGSAPSPSGGESAGGGTTTGGNVTYAMRTPTWILPISAPGYTQGENALFISSQYQSLFSYELGGAAKFNIDEKRSLAEITQVSEDGLTYTIKMKDRKWSDGKPITTADVEFWWRLVKANKADWASYREGSMPDNITEFKVVDDKTLELTTDRVYGPAWFVDNQLSKLIPLPKHHWDHKDGETGDTDASATEDGAKAVFAVLTEASKNISTYDSNELWKVVSGPFVTQKYQPDGEVVMAANKEYDGPDKPSLDTVTFKPFTSDDAMFNVLVSGGIDVGYIPAGKIDQKSMVEQKGYSVDPWYGWSITYMPFNFNNPDHGVMFKQKYLRQAMQQLIDQPSLSKVVWQDTAAPTCGPVPQKPGSGGSMDGCAYSFDPDAAGKLLDDHGWTIQDGVRVCTNPGSGADQCGEGIEQGAKLSFKVISQSGFSATSKMFAELKSQFGKQGIELNIQEVPDSVSVTQKCTPDEPGCDWDMSFFGSQSSWYFPVYASGERLFASDGAVNLGSYNDPKADQLIEATMLSGDSKAMQEYNDYLAEELPVLWMPNPVAQTTAFKSNIKGITPQDPTLAIFPQDWALEG